MSATLVCSWSQNKVSKEEQAKLFGLILFEIEGDFGVHFSLEELAKVINPKILREMECVISQRIVNLNNVYISNKQNQIDFDDADKFMVVDDVLNWAKKNVAWETQPSIKDTLKTYCQYYYVSGGVHNTIAYVLREDVSKMFTDDFFKTLCCGVSTSIIKIKNLKLK